ncbi:MAG: family 43 glycosylhydrolase, partial [Clostridia bacterium]|nr:family 43 glycosylhydrolase [Clostridia bacterium]
GTTITSGTNVSAGEYTASIEGNKNVVTYLQDADDNKIVSAVNGTSYYTFYVGDEQLEFSTATGGFSTSNTMTEQKISNLAYVSDPSVIYENGKYYMVLCTNWADSDFGLDKQFIWEIFEADTVDDLLNYRTVNRHLVMTLADFATEVDGAYSVSGNWAPELQKIGDYYYIITTYVCTDHAAENDSASNRPVENSHRTTAILRSRSLTEGWTVWASHLSPVNGDKGWDTIDGIIYQENGNSYLVVSHEHTSQISSKGGSYAYVQLKDDLSGIAPSATWNEMFYAKTITHSDKQVTDGPYLYRNSKGDLLMLWTNNGGYTSGDYYDVMMAKSSNGSITGSWTNVGALYSRKTSGIHVEYDNDGNGTLEAVSGGHTGLVETPEGQLYMFFHINHQENISDGAPKRLVAVAVYEDATTGYLKWGLNPNNKFVELTPEGNAEVTR